MNSNIRVLCTLIIFLFIGLVMITRSEAAEFSDKNSMEPGISVKSEKLFNGKDFSNWEHICKNDSIPFDDIWKITDEGILVCTGSTNSYIRTKKVDYENYVLSMDWRWIKPGNSGILVHASTTIGKGNWPKSVEIQLAHKSAGDLYVYGIKSFKVPGVENRNQWGGYVNLTDDSEKPAGEWNHLEINCRNDEIIVKVNGVLVNQATECGQQSGAICIQSEKREIHFREIILTRIKE